MAIAFFEVAVPRNAELTRGSQQSAPTALSAAQRQAKIENYIARALEKMDRNGDGVIRKSEADIVVRRWHFSRWDTNEDDKITRDEIRSVAERLF
jgi:hypothetical protein